MKIDKTISLLNRTQPDMAESVRALVRERDLLMQNTKSQKQTFDALMKKHRKLEEDASTRSNYY